MSTAREIIAEAFGEIGVLDPAEPLSAADADFALTKLNTIVDSWGADNSLAFTTTTTVIDVPGGAQSLTIGPGQQIDVARPLRIEGSSFVRVGSVDYPLRVVDEDAYNSIAIKTIGGLWPAVVFFDGGFPTGTIKFWPAGGGEVHLVTYSQITPFADLFTEYPLPPGYKSALVYTLAEALSSPYNRPVTPQLIRLAMGARRKIKTMRVPQLDINPLQMSDRTRLLGIV